MKLHSIVLLESYPTAKQVFGRVAPAEEVGKRLTQFKDLNQRNMLKGDEKDLSKWIKNGWAAFNSFVADASSRTSGKSEKKAKKSDSIRVHETDEWLVVIPLTADASCFYGRETQWCTAATRSDNFFDQYFYNDDITLMYFIRKNSGEKLAIARSTYNGRGRYEIFDKEDSHINIVQLSSVTGFSEAEIEKWFASAAASITHHKGIEEPKRRSKIIEIGMQKLNDLARTDPRLVVVVTDGVPIGYYFHGKVSSTDSAVAVYEVDSIGDLAKTNESDFAWMVDKLHGLDSHPEAAAKIITILRGYTNLLGLMFDSAGYILDGVAETLQQRGITKQHPKFIDLTNSKLMGALYKQHDFNFVLHNIPEFEAKIHEMVKGIQRYWAGE